MSSAVSPFDKAHRPYDFLFAFNSKYASILYSYREVVSYCQKLPVLTYSACIWRPQWGNSIRISPRSLASGNYCHRTIVQHYLWDPILAVSVEHRLVTDTQTWMDRQTHNDSMYSTSIVVQ